MITHALSLVTFKNKGEIEEFLKYALQTAGVEPFFELPYILDDDDLKDIEFLKGRIISVHAPCPGNNYFPNLGSSKRKVIDDSLRLIEDSVDTALRFGASFVVLHAGYATDLSVYMDPKLKETELRGISLNEMEYIKFKESSVCRHEYLQSECYREHLNLAIDNLQAASALCESKGIHLAVENLNPRISHLFQTADDLLHAMRAVPSIYTCVDLGHLWISSLIHQFDFLKEIIRIAETGRVISTHIHNNRSVLKPKHYIEDEHAPLSNGVIPLREAVHILYEKGVKNYVIESIKSAEDNLKNLAGYLKGISGI